MLRRNRQKGFSAIELLLVIAIAGILAAIALPAYRDSVRKSGRTGAKGALLDVAMRQEQFFLNNRSYSNSLAALGLPDPYFVNKSADPVAGTDSGRVYKISLDNATGTAYDAVATAVSDQSEDMCGNYTLKSSGDKLVSGAAGAARCW